MDAPEGEVRRANIASISTPYRYNPQATSAQVEAYKATDENPNSHWVATQTTSQTFTITQLHTVSVEFVVIDWFLGAAGSGKGTYAKSYTIEVHLVGEEGPDAWVTIYETTNGDGGDKDVLSLADDFSGFGYNGELADQIRLTLTERGNDKPGFYYGITEFEVYGTVEDQLFLRKPDPLALTATKPITWWSDWIKNHPGNFWFIGNEPDNFDLDLADGMTPTEYGKFYARVATFIRDNDPAAQIIFCQGTRADKLEVTVVPTPGTPPTHTPGPTPIAGTATYHPYGGGPGYCNLALAETDQALDAMNSPYSLADVINGFSTHQYIYGKINNQATRVAEITGWQSNLDEFAEWVNGLTSELLDQRPLYMTEYGDFSNFCTPTPGPGTPDPIVPAGCGTKAENYAWFGDNTEQGFWAIQFYTSDYFLRTCTTPSETNCNAQWAAAWWFIVGHEEAQAYRGGLLNNAGEPPIINTSGAHYRDGIDCHVNNQNCPPTSTPTP